MLFKLAQAPASLHRKRWRAAVQVVVGRGLHLRLIDQTQSVDRCRWLSTLLRLQVVPVGIPGLEVQRVVWHHNFTAHGGGSLLLISAV